MNDLFSQQNENISGVPEKYWNMLPTDDKNAYLTLKKQFADGSLIQSNKQRHQSTFRKDLNDVSAYIDRRDEQVDVRAIVCGIYFGKGFVCINTKQLKHLIGRCKSSINNGLQSMGYTSSKGKIRQILSTSMPALKDDTSLLRQWTLRGGQQNAVPLAGKSAIITAFYNSPPEIKISSERRTLPTPLINMASIKAHKATSTIPKFPLPTYIHEPIKTNEKILPKQIPILPTQTEQNYDDFLMPSNLNTLFYDDTSIEDTMPTDWFPLD